MNNQAARSRTPTLSDALAQLSHLRDTQERLLSEVSELKATVKRISSPPASGESGLMPAIPRAPQREDVEVVRELVKLHGRITTAELIEKTGWNKQRVWRQIDKLEDQDEVKILRGRRDPETHRRGPDIVVHDSAIAV